MTRHESGTISLFVLGLCLMLFALGGVGVDLWRAFSERRALAAAADAAALAGARALDTTRYRAHGEVRLDPDEAEALAAASLAEQLDRRALRASAVTATERSVSVEVEGAVDFTLLRFLTGDDVFTVRVRASAEPFASG